MGQVGGPYPCDPFGQEFGVAALGSERAGEGTDEICQVDHVRASGGQLFEHAALGVSEVARPGEQQPGQATR